VSAYDPYVIAKQIDNAELGEIYHSLFKFMSKIAIDCWDESKSNLFPPKKINDSELSQIIFYKKPAEEDNLGCDNQDVSQ